MAIAQQVTPQHQQQQTAAPPTTVASRKFNPEKQRELQALDTAFLKPVFSLGPQTWVAPVKSEPKPIYWWCIERALDWDPGFGPDLIADDDGDATHCPAPVDQI
ncbi:hypothetical protein ACFX1T_002651 [Malus domestica]